MRTVQRGRAFRCQLQLLDANGVPVGGAVPWCQVRHLGTDDLLDFSDGVFKPSGTGTLEDPDLTEDLISGGTYYLSVATDEWPDGDFLVEYFWGSQKTVEIVHVSQSDNAEKVSLNRLAIDMANSRLVLYDNDGTTVLMTWNLTDKAGGNVTLVNLPTTVPVNRSAKAGG